MVGMLKTTIRRLLKQAHLDRPWWSDACRFAGHMMREKLLNCWVALRHGHCLVNWWESGEPQQGHHKSSDNRGAMGYLLDIDIWQRQTTKILQDGVVIKGLRPQPLEPAQYRVNPSQERLDRPREGYAMAFTAR